MVLRLLKQTIHFGEGTFAKLSDILRETAAQRVFLVVDPVAYQASGAARLLEPILQNCAVSRFSDFEPNPKLADVQQGIAQFRDATPEIVIALGGGTALDMGKLISVLVCQSAPARQVAVGESPIEKPGPPLVAIPTTAGTGSEATHFAVVYVDGKKYSLAHAAVLPSWAIVDPLLTANLPTSISATTGIDAFCQAVESLWAVGATEESIEYAAAAIELVQKHLVVATKQPTGKARAGMSRAALLAGQAINLGKTTLPHALSYAITSGHGVPHGFAVALTLGSTLAFNAQVSNSDCNDPRGPQHVHKQVARICELLGASSVVEACRVIETLLEQVGCPRTLAEVGITQQDAYLDIAQQVNVERLGNNPRQCTTDDLLQLLRGEIQVKQSAVR